MTITTTHVELTQDDIVEILEREAPERAGMSAKEMVEAYRAGRLEEPGVVIDLLSLAGMLDTGHPLYLEP
jgi:hypothetical protein